MTLTAAQIERAKKVADIFCDAVSRQIQTLTDQNHLPELYLGKNIRETWKLAYEAALEEIEIEDQELEQAAKEVHPRNRQRAKNEKTEADIVWNLIDFFVSGGDPYDPLVFRKKDLYQWWS